MNVLNWKITFLVLGLWHGHASGLLRGKCRECFASNSVACVDETSFATCRNGMIAGNTITPCPDGTVCTEERKICLPRSTGASPVCFDDNCSVCKSSQSTFACVDETSYGICYDGVGPDPSSIKSCPNGRVCSLESSSICVLKSDGGIPSCKPESSTTPPTTTETGSTMTPETPTPTEPTTTPGQPLDPNKFCAAKRKEGKFKATDDTTCKKYILCYLLSGQYLGQSYYCPGYFNEGKARCQDNRPSTC